MNKLKNLVLITLSLLIFSCNNKINLEQYNAEKHLSEIEIQELTYSIIRHLGKMHKKANHENKFDDFFNEYYFELTKKHELIYYVPEHTDGYTYFCYTRIAPSLKVKKVAIAGRFKRNSHNEIEYYEEIYRTWKMLPEELKTKNDKLFAKLLKGEDLSAYYNHNSGEEEWIEFPDKDINFNTELRRWIKSGNVNPNEQVELED